MDTAGPVELAPRVWWVGSLLPGDDFQCHVYLVEQGDQSVLIDPGSALTADEVIRKVDAVVGLANVRWLVCSHCDPDIAWVWPFDRRENRATAWLAGRPSPLQRQGRRTRSRRRGGLNRSAGRAV